jgi:putative tryptophan/tyrosine transport system substrate-binding protein
MKRRDFLTLLGGAAAAWPLAARAQQSRKLPTIGFLGANNASFERASIDAFVQRLRNLGSTEGRTIAIEYCWAEGTARAPHRAPADALIVPLGLVQRSPALRCD